MSRRLATVRHAPTRGWSVAKAEALRARAEAGQAEGARLMALSPMDLAAELMLAFGPDGPKATITVNRGGTNQRQLVKWVLRQHEVPMVELALTPPTGGR